MNERWVVEDVLRRCDADASAAALDRVEPHDDAFLTLDEATKIVNDTLEHVGRQGDGVEYAYLIGHRKRLAKTLTMIPKASTPGMSLLDVGSYGYMPLWAKAHLGYDVIAGVEWQPDSSEKTLTRTLDDGASQLTFPVHNFDLSKPDWPIDERFDTVLFFETLEHINEDPMGVMERVNRAMRIGSTLVMSVPNSVSYKALREFMVGMPPWTYWFFHPDLAHEPRHSFEYTPLVFRSLLLSAGFEENAFDSIYAYSSRDAEEPIIGVARSIAVDTTHFGDTLIARATKTIEGAPIRYPSLLYDASEYYRTAFPLLEQRMRRVLDHQSSGSKTQDSPVSDELAARNVALESDLASQRATIEDLLFTCDRYLAESDRLRAQADRASEAAAHEVERARAEAQASLDAERKTFEDRTAELQQELRAAEDARSLAAADARDTRDWAEQLSTENGELRAHVNELLFACDLYLQRVNDPGHAASVIRQSYFRGALDRSKKVVRRVPVVRTALRPVYNTAKRIVKSRL